MGEIGGAIISITLVMMLVFIPVSFMSGTTGVFYRQFGLTMAIAIGISALNALTLSPALCAVFLKGHDNHDPIGKRMGNAYGAAAQAVAGNVKRRFTLDLPPLVTFAFLTATITFMVLGWYSLEHPVQLVIASACAIVTILGIFGKRFHKGFEIGFGRILKAYNKFTSFFINHKITSFSLVALTVAILVWLMNVTNSTLACCSAWSTCPRAHRRSAPMRCSTRWTPSSQPSPTSSTARRSRATASWQARVPPTAHSSSSSRTGRTASVPTRHRKPSSESSTA